MKTSFWDFLCALCEFLGAVLEALGKIDID